MTSREKNRLNEKQGMVTDITDTKVTTSFTEGTSLSCIDRKSCNNSATRLPYDSFSCPEV